MKSYKTQALIIGSGFGGAAPALRLSSAGVKTIVLEKGPEIIPQRDFKLTQDPAYLTTYIKSIKGKHLSLNYAEGLGGGSGFYEMVSLRAPSSAFEQKGATGTRIWPATINRVTLNRYYQLAEEMLSVRRIKEEDVPQTGRVFSQLMGKLGYSADRIPFAEKNCINSGFCVSGCVFGAKQSLHKNYIPQAEAAGTTILCDTEAKTIIPLNIMRRNLNHESIHSLPYRYKVICESKGERISIQTKLLILAGGTLGTASLLLRSRKYLPSLSRQTGRNIAFNGSVKAAGILPDWCENGDMFTGRSIPGMASFEFLESEGITILPAKPLPLQAIAGARISIKDNKDPHAYWGKSHVDLMKLYRHRILILAAIGMNSPTATLKLKGKMQPKLVLDVDDEVKKYYKRTSRLLESILTESGCTLLNVVPVNGKGAPYNGVHFFSSHQLGSCRMADSAEEGVADQHGEVFNYPNMYVSDGSAIPTSLAVNPSLTILANAERIAEGIVNRYTSAHDKIVVKKEIHE